MKTYLLFLITFVLFGVAVFLYKLIAFTSILHHKGMMKNDPLVNYLAQKITDNFENLKHEPKTSIRGMIYSMYLGTISTYDSINEFIQNSDKNIKQFKYNVDQDIFQPLLLKTIVPIVDNFRK